MPYFQQQKLIYSSNTDSAKLCCLYHVW